MQVLPDLGNALRNLALSFHPYDEIHGEERQSPVIRSPLIRVMLLDDHALVREGIARLLEFEPDLRVVGSFGEGEAATRFVVAEQPDVAILDVSLPQGSGIEVAHRLRALSPATRVLVLSMHATPDYVGQAFDAGAGGYVLKECAGEDLVAAVRAVAAGQRYLSEAIASRVLEDYRPGEVLLDRLSRRELQVLKLVVEGNTNNKVAVSLGVSPKSVETYRSRLMAKLCIDDLPALVKFAIRNGITTVE